MNPDEADWEDLFEYLMEHHPQVWEAVRYLHMTMICELARELLRREYATTVRVVSASVTREG